jgi:hypothetical protein
LKTSDLYVNPKEGAVRVSNGFSWLAFLFGSLWFAAKRMWLPYFVVMLPIDTALWFLTGYAEGQGNALLALLGLIGVLVYAIVRGKYANRWLASSLRSKGYKLQPAATRAA